MTDEEKKDKSAEDVLAEMEEKFAEEQQAEDAQTAIEVDLPELTDTEEPQPDQKSDEDNEEKPEKDADQEAESDTTDDEPEQQEETTADDESEPEKTDKSNKAFAQMRKENKELRDSINQMQKQMEEIQTAKPQKQESELALDANQVADIYVQARTGDQENADNLRSQQLAEEAFLKQLPSDQIADVFMKAKSGGYGVYSEDVMTMTQNALAVATARESRDRRSVEQKQAEEQKELKVAQEAYQKELEETKEKFPELLDPKNPIVKANAAWDERMLGKIDIQKGQIVEPGMLSESTVRHLVMHPKDHAILFKESLNAAEGASLQTEVEKLKKDNSELRARLGLRQSPEGSSAPAMERKRSRNDRTAADVLRDIEALAGASA